LICFAAGAHDIAAAKQINPTIAEAFRRWGVTEP
jgi:hypothetical protein